MTVTETSRQREERFRRLLKEEEKRATVENLASGLDEVQSSLAEQRHTKNYDNLTLKISFDEKLEFTSAAIKREISPSALLRKLVEDFLNEERSKSQV